MIYIFRNKFDLKIEHGINENCTNGGAGAPNNAGKQRMENEVQEVDRSIFFGAGRALETARMMVLNGHADDRAASFGRENHLGRNWDRKRSGASENCGGGGGLRHWEG